MADRYKILYEGGEGETEVKIPVHRHHKTRKVRGGGGKLYRGNEKEILGRVP